MLLPATLCHAWGGWLVGEIKMEKWKYIPAKLFFPVSFMFSRHLNQLHRRQSFDFEHNRENMKVWLAGFGDLFSCLLFWLPSCLKAQTVKISQSYIFSFSAWEPNDVNSQASTVQNSSGKYSISYLSQYLNTLESLVSHFYSVINRRLSGYFRKIC